MKDTVLYVSGSTHLGAYRCLLINLVVAIAVKLLGKDEVKQIASENGVGSALVEISRGE